MLQDMVGCETVGLRVPLVLVEGVSVGDTDRVYVGLWDSDVLSVLLLDGLREIFSDLEIVTVGGDSDHGGVHVRDRVGVPVDDGLWLPVVVTLWDWDGNEREQVDVGLWEWLPGLWDGVSLPLWLGEGSDADGDQLSVPVGDRVVAVPEPCVGEGEKVCVQEGVVVARGVGEALEV